MPTIRSVWQHRDVRILAISRLAAKMGLATLVYGAMVHLARDGASQFQISMVSGAGFLSALLFGMQGGLVADSLAKRVAMTLGFAVQAGICFAVPLFLGTGLGAMLLVVLISSAIMQVVVPGIKALVAIVAAPEELAVVGTVTSVVGGFGTAIGSAFIAPLLIKLSGIELVMYVAGVLFALGAIRAFQLPRSEQGQSLSATLRTVDWRPRALSLRTNAAWIIEQRGLATMILVGAIVAALYESFTTLLPGYVRDVLEADPADSIFIFAPGGLGFLAGTLFGPRLLRALGERRLGALSLALIGGGMVLFGFIDRVAPVVAWVSPLRLLELFGIELSEAILAASVIAIPFNFGSTAAGIAVQTFINREAPIERQGGIFGVEQVQKNALSLVMVLTLGALASLIGTRFVYAIAPVVAIGVVVWLVRYSYRVAAGEEQTRREALQTLLGDGDEAQNNRSAKR